MFGHCCCCELDRAADQAELQTRLSSSSELDVPTENAWPGGHPRHKLRVLLPHAPTPKTHCAGEKGPGWDGERLGDDEDEKHHLGQAKASVLEVRVSQPTKPCVALSTTSPQMCLPLARGSPLQLFLGQEQQLYITLAKPKQPQEQELLLRPRGKGTASHSKVRPATTGLLVLKAAEFSYGNGGFYFLAAFLEGMHAGTAAAWQSWLCFPAPA